MADFHGQSYKALDFGKHVAILALHARFPLTDEAYMALALEQARMAADMWEVPIGACLVVDDSIIATAHNLRERETDPTAHAELIAIRKASIALKKWRLSGATLYVTLEPCIMCMGAALLARIDRIVFGAHDPKGGAAGSLYDLSADPRLNHAIRIRGGVEKDPSAALLREFFQRLRRKPSTELEPRRAQ